MTSESEVLNQAKPPGMILSSRGKPQLLLYRRLEKANPQLITGLICFLFILVLECCNPPFFFGDDNMQFTFVHMSEIARNLVHGDNIFRHHYIFGGDFDMLSDPAFLCLWHPLSLMCSLLTLTPLKYWAVDAFVAICLISAGLAMSRLLVMLREQGHLRLSNTLLVFLSASYACSGFALIVGEVWGNFTANIAALPMFLIGILHGRRIRGIAWVTFASLLGLFAGHPDPLVYSFLTLFALACFVSWQERSFKPISILLLGVAMTTIISSPFLLHAASGFITNGRSSGLNVDVASRYSVPMLPLLAGYFAGVLGYLIASPVQIFWLPLNGCFQFSMNFSSLLFFVALRRCKRDKWLSHVFLLLLLFSILLVERPSFLAQALAHVPILKSFKWPFRQVIFFQFFMTLWIAVNLGRFSVRYAWKLMLPGLLVTALSLHQLGRLSFTDYGDREFLLSGTAERFWTTVKSGIPKDAVVVGLNDDNLIQQWEDPLCLAGAVNFPALYQIRMAGGYSFSKPCNTVKTSMPCHPFLSMYHRQDIPALLAIYRKLYVIEVLPPSSVRMGVLDSDFAGFLANAEIIDYSDTNQADFCHGNFKFHKSQAFSVGSTPGSNTIR